MDNSEKKGAEDYAVALRKDLGPLMTKGDIDAANIATVENYDLVRNNMSQVAKGCKVMDERMNERFCNPAYALWKNLVAVRDGATKPLRERAEAWGRSATAWRNEENRRRAVEEEKRVAEIRRQQEEQRKREEEARQERLKAEEDARVAVALEAEARGDKRAAEAILTTPTPVPEIVPPPAPIPEPMPAPAAPKLAGGVLRWKAEIFDKKAFLRAAVEDAELMGTVEIKMPILHQLARAMKNRLNIPGVRAVPEESTRA